MNAPARPRTAPSPLQLAIALGLALAPSLAAAAPVLLISIDGLRPDDVLQAGERGLHLPALRHFVDEGAYATGVRGVLPTLTYPSHTTLVTGVWPARHGVGNNLTFDPFGKNQQGWYWYAEDVKVPTLWEAARAGGLSTASVHWPVSVAARGIDFNLPQVWRSGSDDDRKLVRALATNGLLESLEHELGPYADGIDESVEADEIRGRFAARLLEVKRPQLLTAYLTGLDHVQHEQGPGSPAARHALERLDAVVGQLVAAARKVDPATLVAVVSDHGFAPVTRDVNLLGAFAKAGLVRLDRRGRVTWWEAKPWSCGGSAMVVLSRRDDPELREQVSSVLWRLARNPRSGVANVIDRAEIAERGGSPMADFWVNLKLGFEVGVDPRAPLLHPAPRKGMHGHFPDARPLLATFLVEGPGLSRHGSLGEIDMRDVAPSVAALLGVPLPTADGHSVF